MSFMSMIWGFASYTTIANIQVLQNRALRNTYGLPTRISRSEMYLHLVETHLPIRGIAVLNTALIVYKSINGHTNSNISYILVGTATQSKGMTLRNSLMLRPAAQKTNYGAKSIATVGPRIMNAISQEIKLSKHPHAFKWCLRCYLRNEKFINSCFNKDFFLFKFK